jgi:hypothetical protein
MSTCRTRVRFIPRAKVKRSVNKMHLFPVSGRLVLNRFAGQNKVLKKVRKRTKNQCTIGVKIPNSPPIARESRAFNRKVWIPVDPLGAIPKNSMTVTP